MSSRSWAILVALGTSAVLWGCNGSGTDVAEPTVDSGSVMAPDAGLPDGCTPLTVFPDADGDGHGDPDGAQRICGAIPQGFVTVGNDCDDACASCSPVSPELCDEVDNDCDGLVDEDLDEVTTFLDADGDGFGLGEELAMSCGEIPDGRTAIAGDCDDGDPSVSPDALETCNAVDDDCDTLVDEDVTRALGDPVMLGEMRSSFRQLALAATGGGYLAAWTEPGSRVLWARLNGSGVITEGPRPIAPGSTALQSHPTLAVAETAAGTHAVAVWTEDERVVRARSIALGDGQMRPVITLSAVDELQRLAVEPVVAGNEVVALWLENTDPGRTVGARIEPVGGSMVGVPVVLHESSRVEPDNFGPSAAIMPGDPNTMYLGVVDRELGDEVTVGYVHTIQVRPMLDTRDAMVRLQPREGAVRRVLLVPSPSEDVILAFSTHGTAPDEETDVYRLALRPGGTAIASRLVDRPALGLVLSGTGSPAGVDVVLSDDTMTERRALRIGLCSAAGEHQEVGPVDELLAPWASIARLDGLGGAVLYTGRISDTDVEPGIWLRRYGCE